MKLYVAGPMTGLPEYNFPAFRTAAAELRAAGHDVVSPHEVALPCGCAAGTDHTWADYLRADLIALLTHAEGVALLPGWEASRGANLEKHVAERLDLEIRLLDDWLDLTAEAAPC